MAPNSGKLVPEKRAPRYLANDSSLCRQETAESRTCGFRALATTAIHRLLFSGVQDGDRGVFGPHLSVGSWTAFVSKDVEEEKRSAGVTIKKSAPPCISARHASVKTSSAALAAP